MAPLLGLVLLLATSCHAAYDVTSYFTEDGCGGYYSYEAVMSTSSCTPQDCTLANGVYTKVDCLIPFPETPPGDSLFTQATYPALEDPKCQGEPVSISVFPADGLCHVGGAGSFQIDSECANFTTWTGFDCSGDPPTTNPINLTSQSECSVPVVRSVATCSAPPALIPTKWTVSQTYNAPDCSTSSYVTMGAQRSAFSSGACVPRTCQPSEEEGGLWITLLCDVDLPDPPLPPIYTYTQYLNEDDLCSAVPSVITINAVGKCSDHLTPTSNYSNFYDESCTLIQYSQANCTGTSTPFTLPFTGQCQDPDDSGTTSSRACGGAVYPYPSLIGLYDVTRTHNSTDCSNDTVTYVQAIPADIACGTAGELRCLDRTSFTRSIICAVSYADLQPLLLASPDIYTEASYDDTDTTCTGNPIYFSMFIVGNSTCAMGTNLGGPSSVRISDGCGTIESYETDDCSGPLGDSGTIEISAQCEPSNMKLCGSLVFIPAPEPEPLPEPSATDDLATKMNDPVVQAAVSNAITNLDPSGSGSFEPTTINGNVVSWPIIIVYDRVLTEEEQTDHSAAIQIIVAEALGTDVSNVNIAFTFVSETRKRALQAATYQALATVSSATQMVASLMSSIVLLLALLL